jgi:type I restriction enzyme R subunit
MAVLIKAPARVNAICRHIVTHFQQKVEPNGFKAQVVTFDRQCCVLYKKAMDELVGVEASAIVMHTQGGKSDEYASFKLAKDEEEKLLDRFRDPNDPLTFLIVTSKLLTGFDAPDSAGDVPRQADEGSQPAAGHLPHQSCLSRQDSRPDRGLPGHLR